MSFFDKFLYFYNYIRPFFDIFLLAFILYKAYEFISKTNSLQILKALVIVGIIYVIAVLLKLSTLLWIINLIAPGLVISLVVIFQPEVRKLFLKIGQSTWSAFGNRLKHTYVDSVLTAAEMLSKQKRGMLAVFVRQTPMENFIRSGTVVNADISSALLLTIFGMDTPFRDGACLIQGGKLVAAGCFLPLSEDYNIKKTFGTRHRAALGLSEVSDAVVLVVSEETGAISLAYDSKLNYDLTITEITKILENLLNVKPDVQVMEESIDDNKTVN